MGRCEVCGAMGAHGRRLAGPWSAQPRKGYRWWCGLHTDDADAAWGAANGHRAPGADDGQPEPRTGGAVSGGASDAVQGALDL